jgi:hypothetical protein
LKATVTSSGKTVNEGTVTFTILNGTTVVGAPVTVNVASGAASATYSVPGGTAGETYKIQAVFNQSTNFQGSSDSTHTLVLKPATTTTSAAGATATFSTFGQSVMVTANVTSAAGTVGSGTVTFTILSGGTTIGTPLPVAVVAGVASGEYALPLGILAGTYTIEADYGGSSSFVKSTDSSQKLVISPARTTSLGVSTTTSFNGSVQPVLIHVTVTSDAGPVNGGIVTITVFGGTIEIGSYITATVVEGVASGTYMLPAGTAAGNYTIEASYGGTNSFATSGDNSQQLMVTPAETTSVAASASTSFSSSVQTVSLSATITSTAGTVDGGTVTFTILNGTTVIGTAVSPTVVNGMASGSYTLPAGTAAGTYSIRASYSGNNDFATSSDETQQLILKPAITTVSAAAATASFAVASQVIVLSVTITSTAGTVNEGTVTFTIVVGTTVIATATSPTVVNGTASASCTLPAGTAARTYTINAVYNDTGNFATSSDGTQHVTITAATTTTTVQSASSTFSVSQPQSVTVMATVSSTAGTVNEGTETFTVLDEPPPPSPNVVPSGGPPGSIRPFLISVIGTPITVPVMGGVAMGSYMIPPGTPAGTYTLQAQYNGDTNLDQSPYSTQPFVVNPAASTTAAQGATATYSAADQTVTLSANVSSTAGTVSEGQATFMVLGQPPASPGLTPAAVTVIGTPVMVNVTGGTVSTPYTVPGGTAAGSYTIEVDFGGANDFSNSSDSTQPLAIQPAPTTTTAIVAALPSSGSASTVTVTAAVTSMAGTVDGGTVTFTLQNGSTPIGTAVPASLAAGLASASLSVPGGTPSGVYTLAADFGGTTNFQMSSGTSSLTISAAGAAATTTTAASRTITFSASDQTVGLSAQVASAGSVDVGTVVFTVLSGMTAIGAPVMAPVSAGAASASYVVPGGTAVGGYTIHAAYVGTVNLLNSSDTSRPLTVAPIATTTTAMSASTTYSASSQTVPLSASVASTAGTVGGGTVTFTIESGSTPIGSPINAMVSGGMASGSYTLPAGTAAGTYTIAASYSGVGNFATSADKTQTLVVQRVPVSVAVPPPTETLIPNAGQTVALSAQLTIPSGPVDGGTETFSVLSGSSTIGTPVTVDVRGGSASATYVLPVGTPPGTYTIQAAYSGTATLASLTDTSQSLKLTVTLMSLAITPSSATIAAGATAQFQAAGTYSDGSTHDLTGDVTWASSSSGVASISNAGGNQGLATGTTAGASTISASLGQDSTTATLNVTAPSGSGSGGGGGTSPTPPQVMGSFTVAHSKKGLTAITIAFNESLISASATSPALYSVLAGVKKRGKTAYTKPLAIGTIQYADGPHKVTLNLKKPYKGAVQVMVQGRIAAANGASGDVQTSMIVK